MGTITLSVPPELEKEMEELSENWSDIALEAIKLKVFESHLSRSKEMQRAVLESLASKSKLTEKGAMELANKIDDGISKELKEKGLL